MYHTRLDAQEVVKSHLSADTIRYDGWGFTVHRRYTTRDATVHTRVPRNPDRSRDCPTLRLAGRWAPPSHADTNKCTVYGDNDTPL